MRVVHICQRDDPDIGGSLRVAEALVHEQRGSGVDAWMLFLYGPPAHVARGLGENVFCLGLKSSRQAGMGIIMLRRAIKHIAPDLIHSHDGILWPRLVFMQLRIPLVMHAHLPVTRAMHPLAWTLIKKTTDTLIGISEPTIKTWVEAGYPTDKIHYVQNGIDLNRFNMADRHVKMDVRRKLGLPGDKKILLWVGRLHRSMKGAERVEKIGTMLPDDTVLVVVGNGPEYEGILERNSTLLDAGKMILVGSTHSPQDYYKAADAFLFTSHHEPFGLVILEAVASGLPILAFPVDGGGGAIDLLREFGAFQIGDDATRRDVENSLNLIFSKNDPTGNNHKEEIAKYSWELKSRQIVHVYRMVASGLEEIREGAPRVLVCQHGARHRYAIPRMLNNAGMLNVFYTDSSEESMIGRTVKLLGRSAPASWKRFSRWDLQGVPSWKIHSSDYSYFFELTQKARLIRKTGIQLFNQRHRMLSSRMKKWGLCGSNIVYSMYHEDLDFIQWAKEQGALSVIDVFISPITDRIMEQEANAFPDWADKADDEVVSFEQDLWDRTATLADILVCPSEWVADGVCAVSPSVANKIRVVPYGCSIEYQGRVNEPVQGRVLFAGRDPLRKGLHYLAQAATRLKGIIPNLDVRIAGNMPANVVEDPICKDLVFLGALGSDQMKNEYLSADVLVLPALSEGFAGVVAEAIGAGCPVIVTKEAGSPIQHEREGLVVPSKDIDALVEAIQRMVQDRNFRSDCSENCLDQRPFYSEPQWQKRLAAVLEELQEGHSAKGG